MNKYSIGKLPSDILKEVADRHRKLRKTLKLSQGELAERSGVSLGSIKRFESSGQIAFESLLKLAFILNCLEDFDKLFVIRDSSREIEKLFSAKTKRK
jgi:transcriptional regulator with XRE-family HTH domain